jgi:hypothetical protein
MYSWKGMDIPSRNGYIPANREKFPVDIFERSAVLHGEQTFDSTDPPVRHASYQSMATVALGVISLTLYVLLFRFDAELRQIAVATNQGHKAYFLVPIGIAFLFSLVHGAFTDRFWAVLGVKARK